MRNLLNNIFQWKQSANIAVICILLVNIILLLIPHNWVKEIILNTSISEFNKYSIIIICSCALIIIVSLIRYKIQRSIKRKNRKFYGLK